MALRFTARKSIPNVHPYAMRKRQEFRSHVRQRGEDIGQHIAAMLRKWNDAEGYISGYVAAWKLIETLPGDWRKKAERLYHRRVTNTSLSDIPIINYPQFNLDMYRWWAINEEPICLQEPEGNGDSEEVNQEEESKEDPEEETTLNIVVGEPSNKPAKTNSNGSD